MLSFTNFIYGGITIKLPLNESQLQAIDIENGNNKDIARGGFLLDDISVTNDGLFLELNRKRVMFLPDCWQDFLNSIETRVINFSGRACEDILSCYYDWVQKENSIIAVKNLTSGQASLAKIIKEHPQLLGYEPLKSFCKEGVITKQKKGRRAKFSKGEYELYCWASYYYVSKPLSYEQACMLAIDKHPQHIPESWSEDSAYETLRTRVSRKYDTHPELTQKNFRNHNRLKKR